MPRSNSPAERRIDSFLFRLANQPNSTALVVAILLAAASVGAAIGALLRGL